MATQMQIRGGTTAENLLFTGAQREITYDTEKNTIIGHDGFTAGGHAMATEEALADGTIYYNDDIPGGSAANAYILVPKPNTNVPNAYLDGIEFGFVTSQANTGPATADFQGLGVKSIKYPGGVDPSPGDILGRVDMVFDSANDWLELQRKPMGNPPQIRAIAGVSSGNALTLSLDPCSIDFRNPILSNGATVNASVATTISLTVPVGATLGTTSGVQSTIVIVAIYNAGVVELAAINLASNNTFDETALINTTAISAASNSATTFYSANARASVPYRVVGFVRSTQAAAGTWSSAPTQVQGQGGQTIIGRSTGLVSGTAQTTTSGTAIDFTGIPPGVRRITFAMNTVSTNGTSVLRLQIGGGSVETTGYAGTYISLAASSSAANPSAAAGFDLGAPPSAAAAFNGSITLVNVGGNVWVASWILGASGTFYGLAGGGAKTTTATLDRIRLTTLNGTDLFDSGSVNIFYEV